MTLADRAHDREALARANDSVAARFTRGMRASTSRYGVLTDPPIVSAVVGVIALAAIVLWQLELIGEGLLPLVYLVVAAPVGVAVVTGLLLRGARDEVIRWLASLPFGVENMNALLDGVGQNLVVRFGGTPPERDALNALLEQVSDDCFALEFDAAEPEVDVRIGVSDSKLNPAGAAFRRYQRVQALVERALVPLHARCPIAWVRIS
jgi:hypothetical protein